MTSRVRLATAAAAVLAALAGGCQRSRQDDKATSSEEGGPPLVPQTTEELAAVVARVDDTAITVKQLQENINRQSPYIRARYASKEQKRVFLDNMIRFEVLAREAVRRGLDRDPEVIQTMKSAMITKLLRGQLATGVKPDEIPDADLRAFYEARRERFDKPEEVRVSAIVVDKKPEADEAARLARGEQGQSNKGFRELVGRLSTDQESKLRGGDLRYFARDSSDVPAPVVEAAFGLARTGDVAGPIEADGVFYIIKQTGRRAAMSRGFDQVKREIQNELYKQRREGAQKQFVDRLKSGAKIEVLENNLKKVRVDTSSRAGSGDSGQAGQDGRKP